eukprot:TRINITY_DN4399_c2_g1_i1.p2 TRINITY_DN4399_c2_g1~~TRINITY_DN4399_c2_g1_i1.p2  ORF type:complete len:239 (+),score=79.92 TRINITY_DN4399_c2_g1_i1:1366-2082(+)
MRRAGGLCTRAARAARTFGTTILPKEGYERQPWANGLGHTDEVAVCTHAKNARAPFAWRISMADLAAPGGPFSRLENVDRVLTMLDGTCKLSVDGAGFVNLPRFVPFTFPGDVPTDSVVSTPTGRDLNCMVDRSCFRADVQVRTSLDGPRQYALHCKHCVMFITALGGPARIRVGRTALDVEGKALKHAADEHALGKEDTLMCYADGFTEYPQVQQVHVMQGRACFMHLTYTDRKEAW